MLKKIGTAFADRISRWLPDSLVFAFVLTIVAAIMALVFTSTKPLELISHWYNGFWTMLEFAMQMALIVVLGYSIGISRPVAKGFDALANKIKKPITAYLTFSLVSIFLVTVNWGLAPVAAVFATEVCRRVKGIDYRMACAAVYTSLISWHGGLSASAPLMMNTPDNQFIQMGLVDSVIPTSTTLGSTVNITLIIISFIFIPILILLLAPRKVDERFDAALQWEKNGGRKTAATADSQPGITPSLGGPISLSDRLNNSKILNLVLIITGFIFIVPYFAKTGINGLNLNTVNFFFLMFGLLLHGSPIRYIEAVKEAVKGLGDLLIQFPFYAGIMGIFMFSGLSAVVAGWFVKISTAYTYPLFAFYTSAIVNLFIPSGGGEWVVLAPSLIPACQTLGASIEKMIIAFAYGDALTNLINPFWTLAFLPVMVKLMNIKARDFMGYSVIVCIIFLVIISAVLLIVP